MQFRVRLLLLVTAFFAELTLFFLLLNRNPVVMANGDGAIVLFVIVTLAYAVAAFGLIGKTPDHYWFYAIFLWAMMLRKIYMLATPYSIRSYDWAGHVQYIRHMAEHWSIPAANSGWEMYQPPLYYMLAAPWLLLGNIFLSAEHAISFAQHFSLLLSMAVAALGIAIGRMMFRDNRLFALLFAVLIAVFPGIVFFSSRLSNDVLLQALSFLFVFFLLRYWEEGKRIDAAGMIFSFAFGLLTKSSMLLFLPVLCGAVMLQRRLPPRERLIIFLSGAGAILLLTGWFFWLRLVTEQQDVIWVSNEIRLNHFLKVTRHWTDFLIFNPARVVEFVHNGTWAKTPFRQYFWEFFYRSAFTGEFRFGFRMHWIIQFLYVIGLPSIPIFLYGLITDIRKNFHAALPHVLMLGCLLAGLIAYAWITPYAPNQDFRFISPVIIPFGYFLLRGIDRLPWAKSLAIGWLGVFLGWCLIFVLHLVV